MAAAAAMPAVPPPINASDNNNNNSSSSLNDCGGYGGAGEYNYEGGEDYYYHHYGCNFTYDYDDSMNHFFWNELVPVVFVYSLTLLLGLVGNSLVIFSISYYRRMRSVTNVFLLSLATADLLLVLVCVPVKAVAFFAFTWDFGEAMCKLVNYTQSFSMVCSILTLTVISIERVVAVVFPLRAKYLCTMRHAQIVVLCVWLISAVLAVPTALIYIHKEVGVVRKGYWCIKNDTEEGQGWLIAYETYMLTLLFIVPIVIMIVAYSVIAVKVWDVSNMRTGGVVISTSGESGRRSLTKSEAGERSLLGNDTSSDTGRGGGNRQAPDERETRKQVVAMLVMVVLLFAVCWAPILVSNLLTARGHLHMLHYGFLKPMRQAFFLMSYFNSCLNPIVYAFFSRNFRQSFKMAICACVKGKAFVRAYRYSISVASTRRSIAHVNGGGGGIGGGGRTLTSLYETGNGSSENDMTRSPTSYSPESLGLHKI
ncbi:allatostatin-A receptor-like [Babylonia areolata]|uniref:allatostatin-A receptor-like n=1 Tax=Babylonia areolata TaxID=304850 RepID=UPI003FD102C5